MQDGFLHAVALKRGASPMLTFGHPEVYIGRQLCALFWFGEHLYTGLLVDYLYRVESLPIGPVYMGVFIAILFFSVGSTSPS